MTIETKYNIGDEVWFISNNRIANAIVRGYHTSYGLGEWYGEWGSWKPKTSTTYFLRGGDKLEREIIIDEQDLFATKEEILNNL